MHLIYLDESGSTGLDLDNIYQPFFVLAGIIVEDNKWHDINNLFEQEKINIYSDFKNLEIHTNELFNSNKKSAFYKNDWKYNFQILEKLVDLVSTLDIKLIYSIIHKPSYKDLFITNHCIDPYLYSFSLLYEDFNTILLNKNDLGIFLCDELQNLENDLNLLYPRLQVQNNTIIEKTFYLNSKNNNFIQIADICAFYINKYNCIKKNNSNMDPFKKKHCIDMYNKIKKISSTSSINRVIANSYFDKKMCKE